MKQPLFRILGVTFGFFLLAGLLQPALGDAASSAAGAAQSPVTVSQSFGAWGYRCVYAGHNDANGPTLCLAEQDLSAEDHGKTVPLGAVLIGKGRGPKGEGIADAPFRLTLMTPLGFALTHPASLAVDKGAPVSFVYQTCTTQGCLATGDVPAALMAGLRHGKTGHLQITKIAGGTVTINFDLAGLAGALAAIDAAGSGAAGSGAAPASKAPA